MRSQLVLCSTFDMNDLGIVGDYSIKGRMVIFTFAWVCFGVSIGTVLLGATLLILVAKNYGNDVLRVWIARLYVYSSIVMYSITAIASAFFWFFTER